MAVALELDPEQLERAPDKAGVGSPMELHPAAMRAACDLIDRLYQNGLLDLLRAFASSSGDIAAKVAEGADTGKVISVVRNGMTLLSMLGAVDPATLQNLASQPGDEQSFSGRQEGAEPPSLWALFRRFSSNDSRRGLALIADTVESIGRAARKTRERQAINTAPHKV
jgi:uncharacterized protein YjgD (DUF1641 family)